MEVYEGIASSVTKSQSETKDAYKDVNSAENRNHDAYIEMKSPYLQPRNEYMDINADNTQGKSKKKIIPVLN